LWKVAGLPGVERHDNSNINEGGFTPEVKQMQLDMLMEYVD